MSCDDQTVLNDIQDVEKNVSITPTILGPADTTGNPLNLEKIQLDASKSKYLQPLATFNTVAKGISNVSFRLADGIILLTQRIHLDQSTRSTGAECVDCSLRGIFLFISMSPFDADSYS